MTTLSHLEKPPANTRWDILVPWRLFHTTVPPPVSTFLLWSPNCIHSRISQKFLLAVGGRRQRGRHTPHDSKASAFWTTSASSPNVYVLWLAMPVSLRCTQKLTVVNKKREVLKVISNQKRPFRTKNKYKGKQTMCFG